MKIIDCHLHFSDCDGFREVAKAAGHENTPGDLLSAFVQNGIIMGIAMGEMGGERQIGLATPRTPNLMKELPPHISYCCGLESEEINAETVSESLNLFRQHFDSEHCVGLKLYPGYNSVYSADPRHDPFLELAEAYDMPVVIHTGETAGTGGLLKYSHPLTVDEVAVRFPKVRFVMAHYGNPWIADATAVAAKNPNVFIDLSGFAEGCYSADSFYQRFHRHMEYVRTWLDYLADYDKVLYGSDWPLVSLETYIGIIRRLVPEEYHEKVFFENALRVFPKLKSLLNRNQ